MNYAQQLGEKAKVIETKIATASPMQKNQALRAIADALIVQTPAILEANAADLAAAQENHMTASLQDRLRLTEARIQGMAAAVLQLVVRM